MVCYLALSSIKESTGLIPNSVDPDQTPHSAASDLCLHCLPVSVLWDARHEWVKCIKTFMQKNIIDATNKLKKSL